MGETKAATHSNQSQAPGEEARNLYLTGSPRQFSTPGKFETLVEKHNVPSVPLDVFPPPTTGLFCTRPHLPFYHFSWSPRQIRNALLPGQVVLFLPLSNTALPHHGQLKATCFATATMAKSFAAQCQTCHSQNCRKTTALSNTNKLQWAILS